MNSQNSLVVGGKTYIAVAGYKCEQCHLVDLSTCSVAPCAAYERDDGMEVIFVEKQYD